MTWPGDEDYFASLDDVPVPDDPGEPEGLTPVSRIRPDTAPATVHGGQPPERVPSDFRARLLGRDQLRELPQPAPLIEGTLDLRTIAVLSGRRARGKSLLALDWAASIATGKSWQGRGVEPGPVLWVAAEGAYGTGIRVDAWEYAWHREIAPERLRVFPAPVNLFTGRYVDDLLDVARTDGIRLLVLDTWSRCTVGGRENDNSDATAALERLEPLRHLGATSLVVAHTDAEDGKTRGATALEDNVDTVYRIKGDPEHLVLQRTKRKDGPEHDELHLRLRPALDSVVVESATGVDRSESEDKVLSAYLSAFDGRQCSKAELRSVAGMPPSSFHRGLTSLVKSGALIEHGQGARASYTKGPE